jgi:hypothetical protein
VTTQCSRVQLSASALFLKFFEGLDNLTAQWRRDAPLQLSFYIDLKSFIAENHFVITGYKSPQTPVRTFITEVEKLIQMGKCRGLEVVVMGDFNFNMMKSNALSKSLEANQLVNCLGTTKTTDYNTQIDIVFSTTTAGRAGTFASYISDHFAIF